MKVTLDKVTKIFGKTTAVNDFSAELPDGHLICLLGPSGCGKSTVLNMLCGITDVTSGRILFDGRDVTAMPPDRRNIGMVFQNYALYPHLSVLENITFPLEVRGIPRKERISRAEKIAALVHVDMLLGRFPGELSGGQQQRVAIARALVKEPSLLLMDEPLSNLDARLRLEMREEIRRIQQETGVTAVFVTHDQEEAMAVSDSIILMKDGSFVQGGLCQELYDNPNSAFVADFLGNPPVNKISGGKILRGGETDLFCTDGLEIPLGFRVASSVPPERGVTLSIRPESFFCSADGFPAEVASVSVMGKDRIVGVHCGQVFFRAVLQNDGENPLRAGDSVKFGLRRNGVFLFDSGTGERIL